MADRKATYVKDVSERFIDSSARLYSTDDGYVVASSTSIGVVSEVKVFASDENGDVLDYGELGVAYPAGEFDAALTDAGFEADGG